MFSTTGPSLLGPFDPNQAVWFAHETIYAARAVEHQGQWYMLGFINGPDDNFPGYICDPILLKQTGKGVVPA
jgi:hypothetical protein